MSIKHKLVIIYLSNMVVDNIDYLNIELYGQDEKLYKLSDF